MLELTDLADHLEKQKQEVEKQKERLAAIERMVDRAKWAGSALGVAAVVFLGYGIKEVPKRIDAAVKQAISDTTVGQVENRVTELQKDAAALQTKVDGLKQ